MKKKEVADKDNPQILQNILQNQVWKNTQLPLRKEKKIENDE